jgi:hypothetical protein
VLRRRTILRLVVVAVVAVAAEAGIAAAAVTPTITFAGKTNRGGAVTFDGVPGPGQTWTSIDFFNVAWQCDGKPGDTPDLSGTVRNGQFKLHLMFPASEHQYPATFRVKTATGKISAKLASGTVEVSDIEYTASRCDSGVLHFTARLKP